MIRPGDFGLVRTRGDTSRLIGVAEWLDEIAQGHWLKADENSLYRHAFLVERVDGPVVHAIEARPSGAGRAAYKASDARVLWSSGHIDLAASQRSAIVAWGVNHLDAPYSWRDYLYQAAVRLRIPGAPELLERQIHQAGEYLCSQFVDAAYQYAGVHLFADGRTPYDVAPSDLAGLLQ